MRQLQLFTFFINTRLDVKDRKRLREYQEAGVNLVIGSGYPHLEEAYRVAELLFPVLGIGTKRNTLVETVSNEFAVGFHGKEQIKA